MIAKAQLKQEIYHQIGCDAEDWLESARKTFHGFQGAKLALHEHAKKIQENVLTVQRDLEDGKLEGMEAASVADYAILQIQRMVDGLNLASLHFENKQKSAAGEMSAYQFVIDQIQERHQKELSKIKQVLDAVESGDVIVEGDGSLSQRDAAAGGGRILGIRPGMSVAQQRKAEAAAEVSQGNEGQAADQKKKPKKRRKRKVKAKDEAGDMPSKADNGENAG